MLERDIAMRFATEAHQGQKRKYTNRPYIEHPMRVACAAAIINMPEWAICAAWLHDVVEDCGVSIEAIDDRFGGSVSGLVKWLTNPSKEHPHLKRHVRKKMDREHIAKAPREARILKLLDRIDNLLELSPCETDFKALYATESIKLATTLDNPDDSTIHELAVALIDCANKLKD